MMIDIEAMADNMANKTDYEIVSDVDYRYLIFRKSLDELFWDNIYR